MGVLKTFSGCSLIAWVFLLTSQTFRKTPLNSRALVGYGCVQQLIKKITTRLSEAPNILGSVFDVNFQLAAFVCVLSGAENVLKNAPRARIFPVRPIT